MHRWAMVAITAAFVVSCAGGQRPTLTSETVPPPETIDPVIADLAEASLTATTTTIPLRQAVTLGFAGDTHFVNGLHRNDPLGAVAELMTAADLMAVNLETTVAEADVGAAPVPKEFLFRSPPESAQLLADAGVDVAALGNNHAWDFGDAATIRTIELVEAAGVATVGAGFDRDDAFEPLVVDVGDWRVGIVSASRVPCDWSGRAPEQRTVVAWACDPFLERLDEVITEVVDTTDVAVVMVHWGLTTEPCPDPSITDLAERWAGLDVDLIVGSHPHVLRGVDRIDDTWLLHSTGNYLFGSSGNRAHTALFTAVVSDEGAGDPRIDLHAEPLQIRNGRPEPVDVETRVDRLAELSERSFGYAFDEAGWLHPAPDAASICPG